MGDVMMALFLLFLLLAVLASVGLVVSIVSHLGAHRRRCESMRGSERWVRYGRL